MTSYYSKTENGITSWHQYAPDLKHGKNKSSIRYFLNHRFCSKLPEISKDDQRVPKLAKFAKNYPTIWDSVVLYFEQYGMSNEDRDEILKLSKLYD